LIHHTLINALYPLWIIGLNQDTKTSGGMAGLTFMFKESPGTRQYNSADNANIGHTQNDISKFLDPGGDLCSTVKNAAVAVLKRIDNGTTDYGPRINAKAFLLSPRELNRNNSESGMGVGVNGDELYLFLDKNGIVDSKEALKEWGLAKQYWLRGFISASGQPNGFLVGLCDSQGNAYYGQSYMTANQGYLPAFCL
jgi:hypothetical protein